MNRVRLLLLSLFLLACGDDASSDGGTDASDGGVDDSGADDAAADDGVDAGRDLDVDAGPLPYRALCDESPAPEYPAPDGWEPNSGPGLPTTPFDESVLGTNCAFLDGGEMDLSDHHNLVTMYDGYLMMPWAPEFGRGGITFWDVSNACEPVVRGTGFSPSMRETHTSGFSFLNGAWTVTASLTEILATGGGGVMFWDISDTTRPVAVSELNLPDFFYPEAYAAVVMSAFWQVPFVYLGAGFNGVVIVDASDPTTPQIVSEYNFEPPMRVGQVQAVGNLLIVTATSGARTVLLDISDPLSPEPIVGGDFFALDGEGAMREFYFANFSGGYVYYARKDDGGGLTVMDVRTPSNPVYAGDLRVDGSGGYVFLHEDRAFVGMGRRAATFDISDLGAITELASFDLEGDLDTFTPLGQIAVLSVDADAAEDQGSAIVPMEAMPDGNAPLVNFVYPPTGAESVARTSRVGVTFNEQVDVRSAFEGSVRLYETESGRRVRGVVSAQEVFVNFHPLCDLAPNTEYTFELPAGGVTDFAGNALAATFTTTFRTAP